MNAKKTILIVDDAETNRILLKTIFESEYNTLEAVNGLHALEILSKEYKSISAVVLDVVMPEMNGHELLVAMRKDPLLKDIPAIVVTVVGEPESEVKALNLGATDFVSKPYDPTVILQRVKNAILSREASLINEENRILTERAKTSEKLAYIAYHDTLTGIYNRAAFYELAAKLINDNPETGYVIVCWNIERFKVVNDLYGKTIGDEILIETAQVINEHMYDDGICCRLENDHFAACFPIACLDTNDIVNLSKTDFTFDDTNVRIALSVGIYEINDTSVTIDKMCDRAGLAMQSIKGSYSQKFAFYNDKMRSQLIMEQEVISEMQQALDAKQFDIFLQPQIDHVTKDVVGAEALVRWIHPTKGMISPGVFIPIFERNGFISQLDEYVWERTCQVLRSQLDRGFEVVPISVNISRIDIYNPRLVGIFTGLIEKYDLSTELLRLEITESAYMEDARQLISTVQELQKNGFFVEMDDFGSGYSSLNTLKDVPVDLLKLDLMFLRGEENIGRGGNILSSIVRMAKWLSLAVIAEGVETGLQADYLRSIGCTYIQGYLYSKPLPVPAFEEYVSGKKSAEMVTVDPIHSVVDPNTFWNPENLNTIVFNNYIDAAGVFELHENKFEILRTNEKFFKLLKLSHSDLSDISYDLSQIVAENDYELLMGKINEAIETCGEVEVEVRWLMKKNHNEPFWLRLRIRLLAHSESRFVLLATMEDITRRKQYEEELNSLSAQMSSILLNVPVGITMLTYVDEKIKVIYSNDLFCNVSGYSHEQLLHEDFDITTIAYPDDREMIVQRVTEAVRSNNDCRMEFRMERSDGEIRWFSAKFSVLGRDENGILRLLVVYSDITELKLAEKRLLSTEQTLKTKIREQEIIMSNMQGGVALYEISDSIRIIYANDGYYKQNGYSENEVKIAGNALLRVHPEDICALTDSIQRAIESGEKIECDYRMRHKNGKYLTIHVIATRIRYEATQNPVYLAVLTDITALKEAEKIAQQDRFSKALFSVYDEIFRYDFNTNKFTLMYSHYVSEEKFGDTFEMNEETTNNWIESHISQKDKSRFIRFLSRENFEFHKKNSANYVQSIRYCKGTGWYASVIVPIDDNSYFLCTTDISREIAEAERMVEEQFSMQNT